jgi:hypothetical protein
MNKQLTVPLSNFDLLGGIMKEMKVRGNIFDMRDINRAHNIEDIFKDRGHAILFEESEDPEEEVGHWTCLIRNQLNGGNVIYFDSYGSNLKDKRLRKILAQKYKVLQINPHQFQDYGKSAVCGRYALLCIGLNKLIKNLSVKDICHFLIQGKPKEKSFDQFVLDLTQDVKAK